MITNFQFDAEAHAYTVDNQLQPHVTGILERYGIIDYSAVPGFVLARKQLIGTLVHRATHFTDEDGLSLDFAIPAVIDEYAEQIEKYNIEESDLIGYGVAWRRFLDESDFECFPGYCERRHVAEVHGMRYGMTIDRAGILKKRPTILDIKCTAGREPSWPIQLAGYRLGLPRPDESVTEYPVIRWDGANVWLKPNGLYTVCPGGRGYTDVVIERRDEEVFLAALRLTHWKLENLGHV